MKNRHAADRTPAPASGVAVSSRRADDGDGPRSDVQLRERAIERVALFLDTSPAAVESNVPGALERVLCDLPWESRLRRRRDRIVLGDVRLLWNQLDPDDMRRKRVQFLLEHAERRSRL